MAYAAQNEVATSTSLRSSSQCRENTTLAEAAVVAMHHPLGSWERHLMEERLRAVKRHERERLMREELEKECTFQPHVGTSRSSACQAQASLVPREQQQQFVPVFERLAQHAKEREARLAVLAEKKKQREEEALRHAFHPHVNAAAENREPLPVYAANIPVEERLLHYGRSVEQGRRQLQEERQRKELEEIRQQTVLRSARRSGASKENPPEDDIVDRSKRFLIERELGRAQAQQALMEEHPFRPKVCTTSNAIDRGRKAQHNTRDRGVALYEEGMRRQQQRQTEMARRHGEERKGLHKPATNPLTDDWIHHGQHSALFRQNFVRRQEVYQRVREEHQRKLASALEQSEQVAVPRVDQAMIERQVERLYLGAQEIRKEAKKRMEDHIRARECPFRPELAPGTEYVIAHANREQDVVKRLASTPRSRRALHHSLYEEEFEENGDKEEENRLRNVKVVHPEEAKEFYQRQKRALEEREVQLREKKQRQAMEELCACTFRPRTSTDEYLQRRQKEASSAGQQQQQQHVEVRVSGVSAYLQRQAEAKRRLKEQEERYQKLGQGLPCNGPSGTVITPFNLSSGRGSRPSSLGPRFSAPNTGGVAQRDCGGHVDPYSSNGILCSRRGQKEEPPAKCRVR
ncbi:200 kDa antigen p200 [Trypanosoma grayi]|uniref:200 kDa antigen p200 n=1 Tax=Trypanosoma grayi TaxID=71804 RepID=UPI0004F44D3C|nr:200 kDa antigen p200 [Trypanosoma grayi]KEG12823.1 200 kDa antigen p200 [Trypanosoma grayi]